MVRKTGEVGAFGLNLRAQRTLTKGDNMSAIDKLKAMVIEGNLDEISGVAEEALREGEDPQRIVDGMIAAMDVVGDQFASGDMFLPEMMLSANTMEVGLNTLRPLLAGQGIKPKASVVFGTVQGDVHDIGKNLVIMMMQGAGFEVHDLGVDVPPEAFCEKVFVLKPDLCCMSALLNTTQDAMERTINLLKEKGLRSSTKILVGGAVITESFALGIGADGFAGDARAGVLKAKELLGLT
jgi:5-methyltetrahydrofolate--homocysteine methyltransferase